MNASPTNWDELVTAGLLGTDRRPPPVTAMSLVDELVDDSLAATDARRLLVTVSAAVVAHRCGLEPAPPLVAMAAPPTDPRPLLPVTATRRWREITRSFALLEDEWLELAVANRWRPPPDLLVELLGRSRALPQRHRLAMEFGGVLADWMVATVADLAVVGRSSAPSVELPSAVPPELAACLGQTPSAFAARLVDGVTDGSYAWTHRATLHHALAAVPAPWLPAVLAALGAGRDAAAATVGGSAPLALWESLIEFAAVRRAMHTDLEVVR